MKNENSAMSGAVAVFVKTPSLSPVKTRLARSIGKENAAEVYRQSVKVMGAVMAAIENDSAGRIKPVWAVAEAEGVERQEWRGFAAMHTGEGDLGARLHNVYSKLQRKWQRVALIGADCPQIPPQLIIDAIHQTRPSYRHSRPRFHEGRLRGNPNPVILAPAGRGNPSRQSRQSRAVIVPATDGGFCLFAAARRLPKTMWTSVAYSQSDTLAQLLTRLPMPAKLLPPLTDIDTAKTLRQAILQLKTAPLPKQRQLAKKLLSLPSFPRR